MGGGGVDNRVEQRVKIGKLVGRVVNAAFVAHALAVYCKSAVSRGPGAHSRRRSLVMMSCVLRF